MNTGMQGGRRNRWQTAALMMCAFIPHLRAEAQGANKSASVDAGIVDSLFAAEFRRDSIGSITVGLVSRAELVWTRSYGYADIAAKKVAERGTVYRIGSITKMFTGVMLQQLIAAGKVRLSDPVSRYVPEVMKVRGHPVLSPTMLQLATMTSGLGAEPDSQGTYGVGPMTSWQQKLLGALSASRFESAPGMRFSYSNVGYGVLGLALERASGTSYLNWQQTRILEPLGMRNTSFDAAARDASTIATGYEIEPDGTYASSRSARELQTGRGFRLPVGAIFTTVDDLSRFMIFQMGHGPESVLRRDILDSTYAGLVATSADMDVGYGVGFMSQRRDDFTWLGHSGGVPGYSAMMYFDRDHQIGIVALRNATGGKVRLSRVTSDALKSVILAKIAAERAARD